MSDAKTDSQGKSEMQQFLHDVSSPLATALLNAEKMLLDFKASVQEPNDRNLRRATLIFESLEKVRGLIESHRK